MAKQSYIVVGGGLAGLMATIRLAEAGHDIALISFVPVKRSHSVCAQGGINGAVNIKGEGDSPEIHFDDTVYGGDFLANQPPVKGMCSAAPGIIYLLDRMGVTFNRTTEGLLDFRRFGGTLYNRTAFAGATTGQQILYALDEQVRRHEAAGLVKKFEFWECLGPILDDDGACRGVVALNQVDMTVRAMMADAVVLATGGCGIIYGKSTLSTTCTGTAVSSAYQSGAAYANGEFIQVHPTAIPGADKLRLMSESARGEGGRVWVPKKQGDTRSGRSIPETERLYFLEDKYPKYGNLVPRDIATREIFDICVNRGMGIGGGRAVYLDLTHIPRATLDKKLGGILEIYEKFVGVDPRDEPMMVFPAVHYSMGGIWVDFDQMTSVPGLFAAGECEYQYHGANRLGANSLLSCIYAGQVSAASMIRYAGSRGRGAAEAPSTVAEREVKRWSGLQDRIALMDGPENPYQIWKELGEMMTDNVTVVRDNARLKATDARLREMMERWRKIGVPDKGRHMNQGLIFTRQLWNMLELALVITLGALMRDESRGAHYKPEFPDRDDEKFLRTTRATWSQDGPAITYEPVDTSLIRPRKRVYTAA
ncbi:MAG TPA: succinate dehydrogenase flavoprotein subunit [Patescibacteria group bacterium]|nr:succinate dehydrogenase flavoprotein subunit [Patescibacteria group bacterium]